VQRDKKRQTPARRGSCSRNWAFPPGTGPVPRAAPGMTGTSTPRRTSWRQVLPFLPAELT